MKLSCSKQCACHEKERRQLLLRISAGILTFIILILLIIFLIWIILRPTKPQFILQDTTIYTFNFSSSTATAATVLSPTPNTLTTTMQVTLTAHNPNSRIGIYYHKLDVYVSYRGQQISLATELPGTYQGHHDMTVWSPFLYGNAVPVSPYLLDSLRQDQNVGAVPVHVKVNGRVKWKVGTWVSGRYHFYVTCPAYIKCAWDRDNGIGAAEPAVKFQLLQSCTVDV